MAYGIDIITYSFEREKLINLMNAVNGNTRLCSGRFRINCFMLPLRKITYEILDVTELTIQLFIIISIYIFIYVYIHTIN